MFQVISGYGRWSRNSRRLRNKAQFLTGIHKAVTEEEEGGDLRETRYLAAFCGSEFIRQCGVPGNNDAGCTDLSRMNSLPQVFHEPCGLFGEQARSHTIYVNQCTGNSTPSNRSSSSCLLWHWMALAITSRVRCGANFSMKSHMQPRRNVPRRKPILVMLDSNNSLASRTTRSLSSLASTAILATIPTPRPRRT